MSPRTASITGENLALRGEQARRRRAAELDEDAGHQRIELRARAAVDFGHCLGHRQRRSIWPRRGHRVEGIGDGEHPRLERDLVTAAAERIAAAVPVLV